MKLENCGRCGLEPEERKPVVVYDDGELVGTSPRFCCPVHDANEEGGLSERIWNAAQFAARTERINAAAADFAAHDGFERGGVDDYIKTATMMIDAQDAAARQRWAEMQKGE